MMRRREVEYSCALAVKVSERCFGQYKKVSERWRIPETRI